MAGDAVVDEDKTSSGASVADYLSSTNKKKKKVYVGLALKDGFDPDVRSTIMKLVEKQYPTLNIATPESYNDLRRMMSRSYALFIVDDHFVEPNELFPYLAKLKSRHDTAVPLLILTEDAPGLNVLYKKYLDAYHEVDDYISYRTASRATLINKVRVGIEHNNSRKSRRFRFNEKAGMKLLGDSEYKDVQITDISVHGAFIRTKDQKFRLGQQLQIRLNVKSVLPNYERGDFMYISAVVRRVGISGSNCGVQFSHIEGNQILNIEKFVISYVEGRIARGQYT